jgi:hypothetical protein
MRMAECAKIRRELARASGMCVRHPQQQRNPSSVSYCDFCLDYWRDRYTPQWGRRQVNIPRKKEPETV